MCRTLKPLFLTVPLFALCAATATQAPSLQDQLAAAEAKWVANKPAVYEFTLKMICFCPPSLPGTPGAGPIVVRVENRVGSLTGSWATRPEARRGLDKYNTVEKQFAFIRGELEKRTYRMEVEYDAELGYPKRVYVDPQATVADEEYGFEVQGFRVLARR